ncbi:hypothetical protein T07_5816 [Trichinella nelsoni]|uniref:Uncharacterized protein n=1 Tax=Trichinella nelsoni TaxID=6336 RepID=A0A0V0RCN4_9BILA|nr:hypothetical protein T07_5816 [Trichinella nelsoni]
MQILSSTLANLRVGVKHYLVIVFVVDDDDQRKVKSGKERKRALP